MFGYEIDKGWLSNGERSLDMSGLPNIEKYLLTYDDGLNCTDPVVCHDPYKEPQVVVSFDPQYALGDLDKKPNLQQDFDQVKVFGKNVPIVKLNNLVIDDDRIKSLKIDYTMFVPTLTLEVIDDDNKITTQNMPSKNNSIRVIIVPEIEGAYKKISLNFYSEYVPVREGNVVRYVDCKYKCPELYEGSPKRYKHDGCDSQFCQTSKNDKPNSFELYHDIAINLGLGYQTTGGVKEVGDRLPRCTQNHPIYEFIKQQIGFGGLDESSIFDIWIDLWGYLTVVNIPWVMRQDIDYRYLGINAILGQKNTDKLVQDPHYALINRTLWNFPYENVPSNLQYLRYERIIDYSNLIQDGCIKNFFQFNRAGDPQADESVGGNNLNQVNIQAKTKSYDEDNRENWQTQTKTVVLTETNEYPTALQKEVRNMFLTNMRSDVLKVEMKNINLGLQRGTLVNFIDFSTDAKFKKKSISEASAIDQPKEDTSFDNPLPKFFDEQDTVTNDGIPLPDMSKTMMYYIDGMIFEYIKGTDTIKQYLFLIPKGPTNSYTNEETLPAKDPVVTKEELENAVEETPPQSVPATETNEPKTNALEAKDILAGFGVS